MHTTTCIKPFSSAFSRIGHSKSWPHPKSGGGSLTSVGSWVLAGGLEGVLDDMNTAYGSSSSKTGCLPSPVLGMNLECTRE